MKNTGKLLLVALFLCGAFVTPGVSRAATIDEQRIALIEQLITVLQTQVANLMTQLEAQITTIKQPVLGSINTMNDEFTVDVSTEFGKGSWEGYREGCKAGECGDDFLDGKVRFIVSGSPKSIVLTYYPENDPTESVTTGGIFKDGVGIAGYFKPNTKFIWKIDATNDAGQVAHVEGDFKTGKY